MARWRGPLPSLHHELGVALSACDDHIHPDPHGLRRGGDHVVDPVVSLHAEGQGGVRALGERTRRERVGGRMARGGDGDVDLTSFRTA